MESFLSWVLRYFFAVVGFITSALLVTRWLMKEVGKFARFCRRWKAKYFPELDKPALPKR